MPYLAERWLWLGDFPKARAFADRAWELAGVDRYERDFIRAALFKVERPLAWATSMWPMNVSTTPSRGRGPSTWWS